MVAYEWFRNISRKLSSMHLRQSSYWMKVTKVILLSPTDKDLKIAEIVPEQYSFQQIFVLFILENGSTREKTIFIHPPK